MQEVQSIAASWFARARENARRASCQSNLKQIGLGMAQYVQDYDERFPMYKTESSGGPGTAYTAWACNGGSGATDVAPIFPYTKSIQILQCPSEPNQPASSTYCKDITWTDYFYNRKIGSTPDGAGNSINSGTPGRKLAQIDAVAVTILLGDGKSGIGTNSSHGGTDNNTATGPAAGGNSWIPNRFNAARLEGVRHLQGANYAFVDGHVKHA